MREGKKREGGLSAPLDQKKGSKQGPPHAKRMRQKKRGKKKEGVGEGGGGGKKETILLMALGGSIQSGTLLCGLELFLYSRLTLAEVSFYVFNQYYSLG